MKILDQLPKSINGMLEPAILIKNSKYASWLSDLRLKPQRKTAFVKTFLVLRIIQRCKRRAYFIFQKTKIKFISPPPESLK